MEEDTQSFTSETRNKGRGSGRIDLQKDEKYIIYNVYCFLKNLADKPGTITKIDFSKFRDLTKQMCEISTSTEQEEEVFEKIFLESIPNSSDSQNNRKSGIYNMYNFLKDLADHPEKIATINFRKTQYLTAKLCKVSERTVQRVCGEASKSTEPIPNFSSPRVAVKRKCFVTGLSDSKKDIVRSAINEVNKGDQSPTLAMVRKLLVDRIGYAGSLTSVIRILHDVGFEYKRFDGKRILVERGNTVASLDCIPDDIDTDTSRFVSEILSSELSRHSELQSEDPLAFQNESKPRTSSLNMSPPPEMSTVNFEPILIPAPSSSTNLEVLAMQTAESSCDTSSIIQNTSVSQSILPEQKSGDDDQVWSELENKQALLDVNQIDAALKELEDIFSEVNQINGRDDTFDSFGRYIVSILRTLPNGRAMELQQEVSNLILRSHARVLKQVK